MIDHTKTKSLVDRARELRYAGDLKASALLLEQAQKHDPTDPRVWTEAAHLKMADKQPFQALHLFSASHEAYTIAESLGVTSKEKRHALNMRAETATHAGVTATMLGELDLGLNYLKVATILNPNSSSAWSAYGSALYMTGDWVGGFLAHDRSVQCEEDDAPARFNRSLIKMLRSEIEGYKEYEARLELPNAKAHIQPNLPRWTGMEPGRVLVVSEQGMGDSIMMERYLKHIPDYWVSVQPELQSWFAFRGHSLYVEGTELSDYWIPMLSLPSIFGVIPPETPVWNGGEGVGVCWAGNADHSNDRDRSCKVADFFKIGGRSLTLGSGDFRPKDWCETAEIIGSLGAVVTVDTAVAHMAGTLGVPTYLIPPTAPEWRWGVPRQVVEKSAWYPSVTIVRRKESKAWAGAIETVSDLLAKQLRRAA